MSSCIPRRVLAVVAGLALPFPDAFDDSIGAYSAGSRISLISIRISPAARSSLTRGQLRAMRSLRKGLLRLPHVTQMIRGGGPRRSWISTKSLSFVMLTPRSRSHRARAGGSWASTQTGEGGVTLRLPA